MAETVFRAWDPDQRELFPPAYRDLVPANHGVHFVRKVVTEDLDLSAINGKYDNPKGQTNLTDTETLRGNPEQAARRPRGGHLRSTTPTGC